MSTQPPLEPPEVPSSEAARYSVQINRTPGTPCAVCASNPSAEGPVGHLNDTPVCDVCLLLGAQELGMLVALAVLVRAFAKDAANSSPTESEESLSLLAFFARIYDRQATWPRRNEFSGDLTDEGLGFGDLEFEDLENGTEGGGNDPDNDPGLH